MSFKCISIKEAKNLIKNDELILIDIRDHNSFSKGHNEKTIHVEDLNIELALKKELTYKYTIKQDYPDIREFLHPIIVTAGKDPSKCLGERPSWAKKKKKKFLKHWPRIREKYGFDKA